MKTISIIAEYNPFHNGHAWQIAEAKRRTSADFALIVMSGDFVQRGEPAVLAWRSRPRTRASGPLCSRQCRIFCEGCLLTSCLPECNRYTLFWM